MKDLPVRRIRAVWLALAGVVAAALLLVWVLWLGAPPRNAVLIEPAGTAVGSGRFITGGPAQASGTSITTHPAGSLAGPTPTSAFIAVYVSGAVVEPGVYSLEPGARVGDAIKAAGGLMPQADTEAINLAARVRDEDHISVPKRAAAPLPGSPAASGSGSDPGGDSSMSLLSTPVPARSPTPHVVNINTAGVDELEALPMIGPALARRIVEHRIANGPFKTVDALADVPGIGEAILGRIRPLVTTGR